MENLNTNTIPFTDAIRNSMDNKRIITYKGKDYFIYLNDYKNGTVISGDKLPNDLIEILLDHNFAIVSK